MGTIRRKGQLTIPPDVRRKAGLPEGTVVEFEVVDEGVLLRRRLVVDADNSIDDEFARQVIAETAQAYAALRTDPQAWAEERGERELWERTVDGLDE